MRGFLPLALGMTAMAMAATEGMNTAPAAPPLKAMHSKAFNLPTDRMKEKASQEGALLYASDMPILAEVVEESAGAGAYGRLARSLVLLCVLLGMCFHLMAPHFFSPELALSGDDSALELMDYSPSPSHTRELLSSSSFEEDVEDVVEDLGPRMQAAAKEVVPVESAPVSEAPLLVEEEKTTAPQQTSEEVMTRMQAQVKEIAQSAAVLAAASAVEEVVVAEQAPAGPTEAQIKAEAKAQRKVLRLAKAATLLAERATRDYHAIVSTLDPTTFEILDKAANTPAIFAKEPVYATVYQPAVLAPSSFSPSAPVFTPKPAPKDMPLLDVDGAPTALFMHVTPSAKKSQAARQPLLALPTLLQQNAAPFSPAVTQKQVHHKPKPRVTLPLLPSNQNMNLLNLTPQRKPRHHSMLNHNQRNSGLLGAAKNPVMMTNGHRRERARTPSQRVSTPHSTPRASPVKPQHFGNMRGYAMDNMVGFDNTMSLPLLATPVNPFYK